MPTTRYTPDTFEQECICLLYSWIHTNGFENPDLPPIFLSFERPSELDKILESGKEGKYPIDEVLGRYFPESPETNVSPYIVLYAQGIVACARSLGVSTAMLRAVVLVHELGHWISHAVPEQETNRIWNTDDFRNSETVTVEAKEMWAQIFTYWVANHLLEKQEQSEMMKVFKDLNIKQSSEYKVYDDFIGEAMREMCKLLKDIRSVYTLCGIDTQSPLFKKYLECTKTDLDNGRIIKKQLKNVDTNIDKSGIF